jgi:hypothetical protein
MAKLAQTPRAYQAAQVTGHPCAGLSTRHHEVFEAIADGDSTPNASTKILRELVRRGLIEELPRKFVQRRLLGNMMTTQYSATPWATAQWDRWATEDGET